MTNTNNYVMFRAILKVVLHSIHHNVLHRKLMLPGNIYVYTCLPHKVYCCCTAASHMYILQQNKILKRESATSTSHRRVKPPCCKWSIHIAVGTECRNNMHDFVRDGVPLHKLCSLLQVVAFLIWLVLFIR